MRVKKSLSYSDQCYRLSLLMKMRPYYFHYFDNGVSSSKPNLAVVVNILTHELLANFVNFSTLTQLLECMDYYHLKIGLMKDNSKKKQI